MTFVTTVVVRVLVTALAVLALVGQVAHVDALSEITLGLAGTLTREVRPSFLTLVVADAFVSAVSGALAIALVFRGDRARGSWGLGVALGAWSYLLAYSGIVLLLRPDPGMPRTVFDAHFPLIEILGLAGLIDFTTRFPRRLVRDDLPAPDTLPVGLRTAEALRIQLLRPTGPWVAVVVVIGVLFGITKLLDQSLEDAALSPVMDAVRFLAVGVVVLNLRRSWMLADAKERVSMRWVVVGLALLTSALALLIGGNILITVAGWTEPLVAWRPILLDLGLVGFLWGLAMAVFYHGKMHGGRVARRVVALTAVVVLGLFLATGLEGLLTHALVARVSLPPGLGTLAAGLVIASTFRRLLTFFEGLLQALPGIVTEDVGLA
jgi:hypothetical protein